MKKKQGVYFLEAAADATEQTIEIIGVIGWEVYYTMMKEKLRNIGAHIKRVVFEIYSPGGDVWEGNGIVQEIGELNKRVETVAKIQVAASMATLIAVACQKRQMSQNGRWLIHNAWSVTVGDAATHEKQAKTLRDCEEEAVKFYALRTGQSEDSMRKLMVEERWMMPEEAKTLGFIQELCDPFKPEEFAGVKAEIQAAGKWPKALALEEPKKKENSDGTGKSSDAQQSAAVGTAAKKHSPNGVKAQGGETCCESCACADCENNDAGACSLKAMTCDIAGCCAMMDMGDKAVAKSSDYERGRSAGILEGNTAALLQFGERIEQLKARLEEAEKGSRAHQSEKDRLAAALAAEKKAADDRVSALQDQLKQAQSKLVAHLDGALSFEPAIETREKAMKVCGGYYAKAADKYPQLLEKFRSEKIKTGGGKMKKALGLIIVMGCMTGSVFGASTVSSHSTPALVDEINAALANPTNTTVTLDNGAQFSETNDNAVRLTLGAVGGLNKGSLTLRSASTLTQMSNGTYVTVVPLNAYSGTATNLTDLAKITVTINDNTAASEDTQIGYAVYVGGTERTILSLAAATTLGTGNETIALNSSDWDISATGDASGMGTSDFTLVSNATLKVYGQTIEIVSGGTVTANGTTILSSNVTINGAGGYLLVTNLPTSEAGLAPGRIYKSPIDVAGLTNVLCIK